MIYQGVECYTIRELAESIADEHSFYTLKGDFLDCFYARPELREELVRDEPAVRDDLVPWMLPFLAAMVHKLCNDYQVPVPGWICQKCFYLAEPRFSHNARGKMKAWLFLNAAPEFKHRNLFVSGDTLERC